MEGEYKMKGKNNYDDFLKITKIGFYIFMAMLLIVTTLSVSRTMKVYRDIDINDALDKLAEITDCKIEYKCNGEYLMYDGLCGDMEETFEFFKNMTGNRECKIDIIKIVEKEPTTFGNTPFSFFNTEYVKSK